MLRLQPSTSSNSDRLRPPTPPRHTVSRMFKPIASSHRQQPQQPQPQPQPPASHRHSSTLDKNPLIATRQQKSLQRLEKQRLKQKQSQERRKEARRNLSDEYLLSAEDEDLYAARIKYLHERRPTYSKNSSTANYVPELFNYANSEVQKGQKMILTYNQDMRSPTRDLQNLVLVLTRDELRKEAGEVSSITGGQKHLDVNMRLHSFIANTQDLIGCWRVMMLSEVVSKIDQSIDTNDKDWVVAGCGAGLEIPMPMEESLLMSVPPDKPEISKSQVATEYIQAQRGFSDIDETVHLFQSDFLMAKVAATVAPEVFERIVECLRTVVQKTIEIEYIEKKAETVQAVEALIEQLKSSNETVVQSFIRQDFDEATALGNVLTRLLIDKIMTQLHANHKERNFEPLRVLVSAVRY